MVVIIHLRGRELALINDVLRCQRTDVEAFGKTTIKNKRIKSEGLTKGEEIHEHAVSCVLTKDVELPFKMTSVKYAILSVISLAVVATKHDKGLKDSRLSATRGGTKDGTISRDLSPSEDTEAKVLRDFSENALVVLELDRVILLEKNISDTILSKLGKDTTDIHLYLALEQLMGDTSHDTCTIAIAAISSSRTSVGHCAQQLTSIRHNFVVSFTLDVADEADTAGVLFIFVVVEALVGREGGGPGIFVALHCVKAIDALGRSGLRYKGEFRSRDDKAVKGVTSHGLEGRAR